MKNTTLEVSKLQLANPVIPVVQEAEDAPSLVVVAPGKVIPFPTQKSSLSVSLPTRLGKPIACHDEARFVWGAVLKRIQEISRIGFNTENAANNATEAEIEAMDPVYAVLREEQNKLILHGRTRGGYIENNGAKFAKLSDLAKFIGSFKEMYPVKKMSNDRTLFMFVVPDGYKAFTSEIRVEDVNRAKLMDRVRVKLMEEDAYTDYKEDSHGSMHYLLYTEKGAMPLVETNVVSFVHNDTYGPYHGLELWQPGQFIGALHPNELEAWVLMNLE